ncbi:MAG: hypothetical protein EON91_01955 [Brevundimonas sp.]|uniref:hypothetical protein n=1 Tax=Brevundimonas sp. TaxID=1871086 RepID=UPI00122A077E|nr:hypothetical protein [Brevundimonas sp.]RZJ19305.1 MAG: hypothetical protein EON91_01955 [Brevundimonas sp.]
MPTWVRYCLLLAMAAWSFWYFGRMLATGLRTGRLIDSRPPDGVPVTRESKPFGFWLAMAISGLMIVGTIYLAVLLTGHLIGYWEAGL